MRVFNRNGVIWILRFIWEIIPAMSLDESDALFVNGDCSNGDYSTPPKLSVTPRNGQTIVRNSTSFIILELAENKLNEIRLTCTAPYPIELINEWKKMEETKTARHLGELIQIYYDNYTTRTTYTHYIHVDFELERQHEKMSELRFRCHSLLNSCMQQTVIYQKPLGELTTNTPFTFSVSSHQSPVTALDDLSKPPEMADECDAIFYYEEVEHEITLASIGREKVSSYSFRCEFPDGTPGRLERDWCFTDVTGCGSILRNRRQPKKCFQKFKLGQTCVTCQPASREDGLSFVPFVATCQDGRRSSRGNIVLYGMPQNGHRPRIYFSDLDLEEEEMIRMNEFNQTQALHSELRVTCVASYYYNVASFQFAIELHNETRLILLPPKRLEDDVEWELPLNAKRQTIGINLDNVNIQRIICFGGKQRSFSWNNASRPIQIIDTSMASDLKTVPLLQNPKLELSKSNTGIILVIVFPIIAILTAMFSSAVAILWWKNKRQAVVIRNLTAQEIQEFRQGNPNENPDDLYSKIHASPFDLSLEIPRHLITYDEKDLLGSGQYGVVLKGTLKQMEEDKKLSMTIPVAVKTVRHNVEVAYFKALLSEIKILAYIGHHGNIASLIGACTTDVEKRQVLAAIEYCEHGDLRNYVLKRRHPFQNLFAPPEIQNGSEIIYSNSEVAVDLRVRELQNGTPLTTLHLLTWARDIANGLVYLTEKKVIHGDIALRNILLTTQNVAKVSDFGLSRQFLDYSNYVKTQQVPLPFKWLSVETLKRMEFSIQSDCWSFGVTLWELFSLGELPYPGYVWNHEFLEQLVEGYRMKIPQYANNAIYEVMLECWSHLPSDRPSFMSIYNRLGQVFQIIDGQKSADDRVNYMHL